MHIVNLLPERSHIHYQALDNRQVTDRFHSDVPIPLNFIAEGGAASQLLAAVDRHGAGSANGRAAGMTEGQASVAFVLNTNEGIENCHHAPDIEPELFGVCGGINFWI